VVSGRVLTSAQILERGDVPLTEENLPAGLGCCPGYLATIADFQAVYTFSERSVGNEHHNSDLAE
jgi:hypothetical protein